MFAPIQKATVKALTGDQSCVDVIIGRYNHRQDLLIKEYQKIGWHIRKNRASMFSWAKMPKEIAYMGSLQFCKKLLQEQQVAFSPGVGFGDDGEGYVRIALIQNDEAIKLSALKIQKFIQKYKK
jgi:alanine-synthesizing transaminase